MCGGGISVAPVYSLLRCVHDFVRMYAQTNTVVHAQYAKQQAKAKMQANKRDYEQVYMNAFTILILHLSS